MVESPAARHAVTIFGCAGTLALFQLFPNAVPDLMSDRNTALVTPLRIMGAIDSEYGRKQTLPRSFTFASAGSFEESRCSGLGRVGRGMTCVERSRRRFHSNEPSYLGV